MKRVLPVPQLIRWMTLTGLILIGILTLLRIAFYLSFNQQGYTFYRITDAFLLGFRFDLRAVALVLLPMLILGSIPFFHPFRSATSKKIWLIFMAIVSVGIIFFYTIDFAHYSYLAQRLNASVLNYLQDLQISMDMVWQSYPVFRILLALFVVSGLLFFLIRVAYKKATHPGAPVNKRSRITSFFLALLILGAVVFGKAGQYPLRWSDAFSLGSDYKANLALNPFESFFNTLSFREPAPDATQVAKYFRLLKHYYPSISSSDSLTFSRVVHPAAPHKIIRPNVILVICESFSGYKSTMYGNPLNTTPFFDSLCRKGVFFDRCFSPTYGTARGVWATLTGIPDVVTKSTASRNPAAVDQHTIMNDFKGYEKYYFLGGSSSWANIRGLLTNNIYGLNLFEQDDFKAPKLDVWGISDKNLFIETATILGKKSSPFFAVIQTADNHRPYSIPEEDREAFKSITVPDDSLKKYGFESLAEMNAFRYTDFCFRKFMEAARTQPYFDNTIFVFIGDHGIPGNAEALFPEAWTKQRLSAVHVPLLYYGKPISVINRVHKIASQVDVLPTLAGFCGINYANTTLGRDLMDTARNNDFAFIFDPDMKQYGIVKDEHFFRMNINTSLSELVPVVTSPAILNDSARIHLERELKDLTEAIYLSAKYLLFHNKKKDVPQL